MTDGNGSQALGAFSTTSSGSPCRFSTKTLSLSNLLANLAEIGHHIFHQQPDLFLAYGFMLRAFGTKAVLYRDDRTGKLAAKIRKERPNFRNAAKYRMAEDEERLCAFLSRGASRSSHTANDNRNQDGQESGLAQHLAVLALIAKTGPGAMSRHTDIDPIVVGGECMNVGQVSTS